MHCLKGKGFTHCQDLASAVIFPTPIALAPIFTHVSQITSDLRPSSYSSLFLVQIRQALDKKSAYIAVTVPSSWTYWLFDGKLHSTSLIFANLTHLSLSSSFVTSFFFVELLSC